MPADLRTPSQQKQDDALARIAKLTLAAMLKKQFPWLGTADGDDIPYPSSGADVIQDLEMFYREVLHAR